MNTHIRQAEAEDLPTLNQISVASKKHWGYPDEWMQRWLDDLTISERDLTEQDVHVLEVEGVLAGFCAILKNPDDYEVTHLWVLPIHIGKGFGKQLLSYSLNQVVPPNGRIVVDADPNAEAFYQRIGFTTVSKIESYPKGRFLPVMEKIHLLG